MYVNILYMIYMDPMGIYRKCTLPNHDFSGLSAVFVTKEKASEWQMALQVFRSLDASSVLHIKIDRLIGIQLLPL